LSRRGCPSEFIQLVPVRTLVDQSTEEAAFGGQQLSRTSSFDEFAGVQNELGLLVNIDLGWRRQTYDLVHVDDGPQTMGYNKHSDVLSNLGSKRVLNELVRLMI
jgi:hypothetical protein